MDQIVDGIEISRIRLDTDFKKIIFNFKENEIVINCDLDNEGLNVSISNEEGEGFEEIDLKDLLNLKECINKALEVIDSGMLDNLDIKKIFGK